MKSFQKSTTTTTSKPTTKAPLVQTNVTIPKKSVTIPTTFKLSEPRKRKSNEGVLPQKSTKLTQSTTIKTGKSTKSIVNPLLTKENTSPPVQKTPISAKQKIVYTPLPKKESINKPTTPGSDFKKTPRSPILTIIQLKQKLVDQEKLMAIKDLEIMNLKLSQKQLHDDIANLQMRLTLREDKIENSALIPTVEQIIVGLESPSLMTRMNVDSANTTEEDLQDKILEMKDLVEDKVIEEKQEVVVEEKEMNSQGSTVSSEMGSQKVEEVVQEEVVPIGSTRSSVGVTPVKQRKRKLLKKKKSEFEEEL